MQLEGNSNLVPALNDPLWLICRKAKQKTNQTWLNCHYKFISPENIIISVSSDDHTCLTCGCNSNLPQRIIYLRNDGFSFFLQTLSAVFFYPAPHMHLSFLSSSIRLWVFYGLFVIFFYFPQYIYIYRERESSSCG